MYFIIGKANERFTKQVSVNVRSCHFLDNSSIDFGAGPMLRPIRNIVLPTHRIISVTYKLRCQCVADYIDRTVQKLEAPIDQHIPADIRKGNVDILHRYIHVSGSVKTKHLIKNQQCLIARTCFPSKANTDYHFKDWK